MFNGSFLRVCRILRFVKKLDFPFLSLGGPSHGARVWCLGRVPKHMNHWQEVEDIQQEPSLFKGHPLSCQYGDALCSMIPN